MEYYFKYVSGNHYDIWLGNGWDNWGRVAVSRHACHRVAGVPIPNGVLKEFHKQVMG
jgi:hypothetical protein